MMRENHERPQQPTENEEDEVEQLFMIQMTDPNIIDQLWLCLSLNLHKNFVLLMTYFKGLILKKNISLQDEGLNHQLPQHYFVNVFVYIELSLLD